MEKMKKICEKYGIDYELGEEMPMILKNAKIHTLETNEYFLSKITTKGLSSYQIRAKNNKYTRLGVEENVVAREWEEAMKREKANQVKA